MVEATIRPAGPYVLRFMTSQGRWRRELPGGEQAVAWQRPDGAVVFRTSSERALERARFMLALDDDHSEFLRRFRRDPLLERTITLLGGYRPLRRATVAHALLRAACGQLVSGSFAHQVERSILRRLGTQAPTREEIGSLSPADLRRSGLATHRASALVRVLRSTDVERLPEHPTPVVLRRLGRERGFGPWSCGVVCLEGLGRWDHGKVGDLALIKLVSSLRGRWVEAAETAEVLAAYGEWQGLAGTYLMLGFSRGLVPGASEDVARELQSRALRAA